jgi:hypothetical protein
MTLLGNRVEFNLAGMTPRITGFPFLQLRALQHNQN